MSGAVYVVGTFDTKAEELQYVARLIREAGLRTVRVDVGTLSKEADVELDAHTVAGHYPDGAAAVLQAGDRGRAVTAMTQALARCLAQRDDIDGIIGLGGSGGTAIITPAMRQLPVGLPKLMVSTLASGDTSPYVGVSDIAMLFPVTDIAGLNRLSRVVLGNAANAMAGMVSRRIAADRDERTHVGISMFGVTTPCVESLRDELSNDYECLVFHANGPGGRAMEALIDAGMLQAVADLTTTEAVDHLFGGVCSAGAERFDAMARRGVPWIGSCGALDMINFWAPATVPPRYAGRKFHAHNANVTLMRTTADEMRQTARWLADKSNRSPGPVRWLIPEGGFSALDAPGQPFHDPAADAAFIETLERHFVRSELHQLIRLPLHINDPRFAAIVAQHLRELAAGAARR
ncbi:MAG: Tm-1-like ATP-binding domain-containing protein [Burkholderiaceae bacterium]